MKERRRNDEHTRVDFACGIELLHSRRVVAPLRRGIGEWQKRRTGILILREPTAFTRNRLSQPQLSFAALLATGGAFEYHFARS
jgi:hypothetical protein